MLLALLRKSTLLFLAIFGFTAVVMAQSVTGTVTDKNGDPITGVSVTVKGSNKGTATNAAGTYTLSDVAKNATLLFTASGYTMQEVKNSGAGNINITLQTLVSNLNEVVVIGYGSVRKKDLTGSIGTVRAKDFNQGIQTAPDQLIQGKIPGVQILNNSGAPGGATTIRIRGNASVRSGSNPLFVVDGVPLDGRSARPGVNFSGLGQTPDGNALTFINSNDIASIDVLKDASATAIYGSRGANGVVMITMKKAAAGSAKLEVSSSVGTSSAMKKLKVLSADEYRSALTKYGLTSGNYGSSVDGLKSILRNGSVQNYSIGMSGGTETGRYRLSLGYVDQKGIVLKTGLKKYNVGLNTSFKFLESKKLSLDMNVVLSQITENVAPISNDAGFQGNLIGSALQWNPTESMRNANGSLNVNPQAGGSVINPIALSEAYSDVARLTTILGSLSAGYKITNDLDYRLLFGITRGVGGRKAQLKRWINLDNVKGDGVAFIGNNELTSQVLTHTLNYNKKISKSFNLNAVVGYEYQKFDYQGSALAGKGFLSDDVDYTYIMQNSNQGSRSVNSFADPITTLQSFFGRAVVNLKDKYLVTATIRADGSSKFGKNNRYGYFPSIAAAWNITNENFMKSISMINNLKLRASWGQTGNQEFPAGASQDRYIFVQGGTQRLNVANPDLKWETTTTTNVGLDFSVLKTRIYGSIDYFNKSTKDILFNLFFGNPAPPSGSIWRNLPGTIVNTGVELSLNGDIIKKGDLVWNLGVNATFLKNTLKNFNNDAPVETGGLHGQGISGTTVQRFISGQPLNVFYLRDYQGLDGNGQAIYTNEGYSKYYLGNPNPKTILGINTEVAYKQFSLTINMNGAFGHKIYNNTANTVLPIGNLGSRNIAKSVLNNGEDQSNPITASSRYLEKGNYMKLANATFNYRIGGIGKVIKNANVYLTGQNLFVITKFTGFDPEVNTDKNIGGVPSFGIEYSPYPTARNFIFGINFSL